MNFKRISAEKGSAAVLVLAFGLALPGVVRAQAASSLESAESSARQLLDSGRSTLNQAAANDKAARMSAVKAVVEDPLTQATCVAGIWSSKRDISDFPGGGAYDGVKNYCSGLTRAQAICVGGIWSSHQRDLTNFPGGPYDGIKSYCSGLTQPQAICTAGIWSSERDITDFPDGGAYDGVKSYCSGLTQAQAVCVAGIWSANRDLTDFPGGGAYDGVKNYCSAPSSR